MKISNFSKKSPPNPKILPIRNTFRVPRFTISAVQQFEPALTYDDHDPKPPFPLPHLKRVQTVQRCIRIGGKYGEKLGDVGKDGIHHTFFEMLGTSSFGETTKQEAIDNAYELLTNVFGLDKNRMYVSYFGGDKQKYPDVEADNEAKNCWLKHLPANHVLPFSGAAAFWHNDQNQNGPCGPCSEVHYDRVGRRPSLVKELMHKNDPTVLELLNIASFEYSRNEEARIMNRLQTKGRGCQRFKILQNDLLQFLENLKLFLLRDLIFLKRDLKFLAKLRFLDFFGKLEFWSFRV